ncbi:energy-coupling factor ABC transporter permease [Glaciecola sp. MF2-115]|uniref:energy-coupling factor ABC transporter permease n=1 Tax=Glaciecola sp. MF2-115 TaxID=3384827 RepID=UPI0039A0EB22
MTVLQILAAIVSLIGLSIIYKNTDFTQLFDDSAFQHRFFGASAAVFILWIFRVGIVDELQVHFLWLTSLALILGFRWAMISATIALLGITVVGYEPFSMLGINWLLGVLLPISLTYAIFSLTFHKLPKNLFIYLFVCAFFPGALSIALKIFAMAGYFYADSSLTWDSIFNNYVILIPLLIFSEAFFNGFTMTSLVVHKPRWVYTFNDKFYIDGK